jgi:hypothetical protein
MIADGGAVDVMVAVAGTAVVAVISVSAGDVDVLTIDNSKVPIPCQLPSWSSTVTSGGGSAVSTLLASE